MRYAELAFTVPAGSSEPWADLLVEAGAQGVEERDATTLGAPEAGRVMLVVWLPPEEVDAYLARVREGAQALPEPVVTRRDRDEDEWRDAWKKYFTARRVGTFVIVPSWERYAAAPGDVILDLDPGRAFGTGGHATTRLCLLAISDFPRCERFLDVGCGSGVLAIGCARRFAGARGVGIDRDPDAVDVSRENAERNRVADRITFSAEPLARVEGRFDAVLANIEPDVLIPMAPELAARLAPGGRLVLSGILVEAAPAVEAAYDATGLRLLARTDDEGWRALTYEAAG